MVVEKGYAKINLALEVVGKRPDGFHDLEMVMTTVNLYDELYFKELENEKIIIECDQFKNIPKENNLIYKAIVLIKERFNISTGIHVKVVKRIPQGAGLAGGSADAAATLRALNKLWNLGLDLEELAELGLSLGSDVPFCIYNKTAVVRGRGEKLIFIDDVPFGYVVMVHPNFSVSTKDIFTNYRGILNSKGNVDRIHGAIVDGDLENISNFLYNDLEKTVDTFHKNNNPINYIKSELVKYGAFNAVMSGSGSTVYGICLTQKQAEYVKNKFISENKSLFQSFRQNDNSYSITVCSIRSSRKSVKKETLEIEPIIEEKKPRYNIIGEGIEAKVYGRALLGLASNGKDYKIVEAPLNAYDLVKIDFLDKPVVEVYINDELNEGYIKQELIKIIEQFKLNNGLLISIKQLQNPNLKIINHQTYLARIIRKLSHHYHLNVDEIFDFCDPKVRSYQFEKTYEYDSKTKTVRFLNNIPYSYVIAVPMGVRRLNDFRSRQNYKVIDEQYENLLKGLEISDYYLITSNIGNSLEEEFFRKINNIKKRDIQEEVSIHVRKARGNNFNLALDGTSLFIFSRNEKDANHLLQRFKRDSYYQAEVIPFRSDVSHKSSLKIKEKDELFSGLVTLTFDTSFEKPDKLTDKEPMIDIIRLDDVDLEKIVVDDEHLEGLYHIASPGSLFKQYDFLEITQFFYKYFDNTKFDLDINGESVEILFKLDCLPHIFGLHLIDKSSEEFRGRKGVQKLLAGQIRYDDLKKDKNIDETTFKTIVSKTQSAFLVLRDVYSNNLDNIYCYDKSIVKNVNSKLDNLKYAITRKKAVNYQKEVNLVGIGFDPVTNHHYFYTSFEWYVNRSITKSDQLTINVKKEQ